MDLRGLTVRKLIRAKKKSANTLKSAESHRASQLIDDTRGLTRHTAKEAPILYVVGAAITSTTWSIGTTGTTALATIDIAANSLLLDAWKSVAACR